MPISISCSHCDWKGKVKDEMGGKTGKCPTCGEHIKIARSRSAIAPAKPKRVYQDPDIVDDAEMDEDEPRPKSKSSRRRVEEDDEDDRPRKPKRRPDREDDEIPVKSRRRPSRDEEDEDEDEPKPRKRRPSRDEDDEERRPRSRVKKRRKPPESTNSKKVGALAGGLFMILIGAAWLAWMFLGDGRFKFYPFILVVLGLIGIFQGFTAGDDSSDDDDD